MSEPTVQMPMVLAQQMRGHFRARTDAFSRQKAEQLDALLSPPTPSADHAEDWTDAQPNEGPGCTCGFNGSFEDCAAWRAAEAGPPRIEDMAPGTMLVGALHEVFSDNRPMRLMVVKRRRRVDVVDPDGCFWMPSDIVPSTIRDVREPEQ